MTLICGTDLETTGFLDTGDHRIVEVYAGLWDVASEKLVDEFYAKVHPNRSIPVEASRVHGITLADLTGCPFFLAIAPDLAAFYARAERLVAHNGAEFDGPFLHQEYRRIGFPLTLPPIIDTMVGSNWATANGKNPTLGELCFAMNVPYDDASAHAASYDVKVMMDCYFTGLRWRVFGGLPLAA